MARTCAVKTVGAIELSISRNGAVTMVSKNASDTSPPTRPTDTCHRVWSVSGIHVSVPALRPVLTNCRFSTGRHVSVPSTVTDTQSLRLSSPQMARTCAVKTAGAIVLSISRNGTVTRVSKKVSDTSPSTRPTDTSHRVWIVSGIHVSVPALRPVLTNCRFSTGRHVSGTGAGRNSVQSPQSPHTSQYS